MLQAQIRGAILDTENLVRIRNYLNCQEGQLLVNYLMDYITKNACMKREASEIKGMCELVQQIKQIPDEVEEIRKRIN